jgi:hypothetical protein
MAPNVILHIGMHKTGTTSIQATLSGFDNGSVRYAQLNDQNHSIPIYSLFSKNKYNYHIHKNHGRTSEEIDCINKATVDDLESELTLDRDTIVISGEDISTLENDEVEALTKWLSLRARSVKVMAYVRDPAGFASSALQQYNVGGMRQITLPTPNYRERFEGFCNSPYVDDIEFIEFDKNKLKDSSVVADFFSRIGLNDINIEEQRTNESMSLQCAQLVYRFNKYGNPTTGSELLTRSRDEFIYFLRQNIKGSKFSIPEDWISANIDKDDVLWMEQKSNIKLAPIKVNNPEAGNPASHTSFEKIIENIEHDTLKQLQLLVAEIDVNIARDTNISNLLNFLFASKYFKVKPVAAELDTNIVQDSSKFSLLNYLFASKYFKVKPAFKN